MKSIADSPNIQSVKKDLAEQALNIVTAELGTITGNYGWNQKIVLRQSVRDELVKQAKGVAQTAIQEAIKDGIAQARAGIDSEYVSKLIDAQVKHTIDYEVKAGVAARLKAIASGLV